jgi:hypothetical protein
MNNIIFKVLLAAIFAGVVAAFFNASDSSNGGEQSSIHVSEAVRSS